MSLSRLLRHGWQLPPVLIAACVLIPIASLAASALSGSPAHWTHLASHVLPEALSNTLVLLLAVGVIVTLLGTVTAWLVTAYDFPGRRILSWALLLPLAVPSYIIAFSYVDLMHPLGPIQGTLRAILGIDSPRGLRLPDIRSLTGCILVLGFVLYPYVYLTTRIMFQTQAASLIEAARMLGARPLTVFARVALPLARPAIAVGVSLALLEAMNDIGASEFLGVQTVTVAIYSTWISRSDLPGAAQIALVMLVLVLALIMLERHGRRRQRFATARRAQPLRPIRLGRRAGLLALLVCLLPVILGFVAPALHLLHETVKRLQHELPSRQLLDSLINTLQVSALATALTVACGLLVAWAGRGAWRSGAAPSAGLAGRFASLGYAIPGTVLAIGLLAPLVAVDHALSGLLGQWSDRAPQLILMGSMGGLVIVYMLRFMAIAVGGIESGLERIPRSLDHAAATLGERPGGLLRRIHLPQLWPAIAAAALLVFVDTMKELPATLLLRPLNFDTLATWLYAEAARGTYEEGAIAALGIVLAGLLPVILLARVNRSAP